MRISFFIHLILLTALSAFAQTAVAPAGTGTDTDPYQIDSLPNLAWISATSSSWSSYFIQT